MTKCHETQPHGLYFYTGRRFSPVVLGGHEDNDRQPKDKQVYEVRIINNDYNTYEEVIHISMIALGLGEAQAFAVAWEVDHHGSCVVAHGPREWAEAIATIIRTIGIEVQVNPVGVTDH